MMKIFRIFGIIFFGVTLFAQSVSAVKIGVDLSRDDEQSSVYNEMVQKGLELAHQERPEVLGEKVELVIVDDRMDIPTDLVAIIGGVSATDIALIAKEAHIPIYTTPWPTHPLAPPEFDHYINDFGGHGQGLAATELVRALEWAGFRLTKQSFNALRSENIPNDILEKLKPLENQSFIHEYFFLNTVKKQIKIEQTNKYETLILEHARTFGTGKAAVMVNRDRDYSISLAEAFIHYFQYYEDILGEEILETDYQTDDKDFKEQLSAIKQFKPDVIYIPDFFGEVARITQQARDLEINIPFISAYAAQTDELLKAGGEAVEGLYITTYFDAEKSWTPGGKRFVELFREKYEQTPYLVSALSWDVYNKILNIIEKMGTVDLGLFHSELWDLLDLMADMESPRNDETEVIIKNEIIIRNPDGSISPVHVLKIENGKFVYGLFSVAFTAEPSGAGYYGLGSCPRIGCPE